MDPFVWSKENNRCFGCGDNPIGLKLEFRRDGEWIVAETALNEHYQGFRGSAHGGIVATLLDEASAWAAMAETEHVAPSYELNCSFLKPVPLEEEITVRARVVDQRHGIVKSKAIVIDEADEVLARAETASRILEKEIDAEEGELI